MKKEFWLKSIIQFVLLLGLWLLLSGHYDFFHISMGVLSALLIVTLNIRLRKYYFFEEELAEARARMRDVFTVRVRFGRVLFYIPWLIWQIVVASLQVAAVVLNPKMPIDPSLLRFKTKLPNTSAKVILGNSITLTPGTITIQIKEDEFLVHALMDVSSTGIMEDSLPREVAKLYEKKPGQVVQHTKIIKSGADI
ncbi:MAG: Na+/H+ antiporter subunit E [Candidatus Aminicenantes bacterium]|nr:MAG: Na+/H+ antiporter subunit E [Candidatus Aminicenantes bacterium]